jgi:hypothetical protein
MDRPIVLWDSPCSNAIDDAGISTKMLRLAPPPPPGPYESVQSQFYYVPPLTFLCLQKLKQFPDQIHALGKIRLQYRKTDEFDLFCALDPNYDPNTMQPNLSNVDPRLWAVLIQVYSGLPKKLETYRIPLSDKHIPLLQHIHNTSCFSLVTVLELPGCAHLTDDTIHELKHLHRLTALDISATRVSSDALRKLSATRTWDECQDGVREKRGPWELRLLRLRSCRNVDNTVGRYLGGFPLLCSIGTHLSLWNVAASQILNRLAWDAMHKVYLSSSRLSTSHI